MIRTPALFLWLAGSAAWADSMPMADNPVAYYGDWTVFVEPSPLECFAASTPRRSTLTKPEGSTVDSTRLPVLQVTIRPADLVVGEVSVFVGDATLRIAGDVAMTGKGAPVTLFSNGAWAWPTNSEADMQVLAVMGTVSEVTMSGALVNGTGFADVYSTRGLTEAMMEAARRCTS